MLIALMTVSIAFFVVPSAASDSSFVVTSTSGGRATPSVDPALLDFLERPALDKPYWDKMTVSVQEASMRGEGTLRTWILTDDVGALGRDLRAAGIDTRFGSVPTPTGTPRVVTVDLPVRMLEKIAARPEVILMAPAVMPEVPELADPDAATGAGDEGPSPSLIEAGKGHHVPEAWALGFTGTGMIVAPMDSGTDFGHPDLQGTYAVNANPLSPYYNWPMAFDPRSMESYLIFNATFPEDPLSWYVDSSFATTADLLTGIITTPFEGISYNVSGIPSASGDYHIGLHPDRTLRFSYYDRYVGVLVTDSVIPGLYDTIYVDLDNDTNFWDDKPVTQASPEIWADYYDATTDTWNYSAWDAGDGIADMSGGLVYFIGNGVDPVPYSDTQASIYGLPLPIPEPGDLVALQLGDVLAPAGDHGTLVASSIVAQNVTGLAHGFAPDAKVLSVGNVYASAIFFLDIFPFVAEGYDGAHASGDEATVASASFGYSSTFNDGWDFVARWVEFWAYNYPFTTYLASTGNGGHGFGTVTSPGASAGVIGVGASTSYNAALGVFEDAAHSTFGDVQPWSNRGPSGLGQTKPDILAVGAWATGDGALNSFGGATPIAVWGGTSLSSPAAAAITALTQQAWLDATGNLMENYWTRTVLVGAADNIHYDSQVMGHGLVNAYRAVRAANLQDGVIAFEFSGFNPTPAWTAGDYQGIPYTSFARLLSPGSSSTTTFTVENMNATASKTVTFSDWELRRTGSNTWFINATNAAESTADFVRPDYLIDLTSVVPAGTDLVKATVTFPMSQLDPDGNILANSRWRVLLYDWLDYNANGTFWTDTNGNGVVNAGEMDATAGTEIQRFTYGYPTHTLIQAFVHDPLARIHDGLLLGIQHRTRSSLVPFTNLTVRVDYYEAMDAPWLSVSTAVETLPPGAAVDVDVTVTVPSTQPYGALSGTVTIADGAAETQVPVIVNVAATGTSFSFGGDAASDAFLDNNRVFAGIDWDWRAEAGDWRFFFTDVPDTTAIAPGEQLVVHTTWENAPTDIDTVVFGPTLDAFSFFYPFIWGPHTLTTVGESTRTLISAGRWRFQTVTGGAEEWVAAPLATGLHEIALHNVMYAGNGPSEVFSGEVGTMAVTPSIWDEATPNETGTETFDVTSSLDLAGLDVRAFGISAPLFDPFVPIETGGTVVEDFAASNAGLIDIIIDSPFAIDIDLYLYRWTGSTYALVAGSFTPFAFERVRLTMPQDGDYRIVVDGFDVPDPFAYFQFLRVVVQGAELTPQDVPAGPIPSGTPVSFNVSWDIDVGTTPGFYVGILFLGPTNAPMLEIEANFFLFDDKPPSILSTSPGPGAYTSDTSPTVVATYADPIVSAGVLFVSFALDGFDLSFFGTFNETAFTWNTPFAIGEGTHTANLTVYDGAGFTDTFEWTFTVDTTGPPLSITSPDFALTNQAVATVAGVTEPGGSVKVNGVPVTVATDGSFSTTVSLVEGSNTITVVATDAAGNSNTVVRSVTRDSIAPALAILSPAAGSRSVANAVDVSGTAEAGADLVVNGVRVAVDSTGAWRVTLAFESGTRTITAVARDAAGNTATVTRTFEVGPAPDTTAPVVAVTSPASGFQTNQPSVEVRGTVDDPTATVLVNGLSLTPSSTGAWSVTLALVEGANSITVSAIDPAGNQGTAIVVNVTYTSPLPEAQEESQQAVSSATSTLLIALLVAVAILLGLQLFLYQSLRSKIAKTAPRIPPEELRPPPRPPEEL